ncbi:class I adenylate-forming enzyme family protein [Micromonospora sp. DT68]|uniref:class I adenylate-forming enzyme family protein n=1 Tax=Micromonospora sp. DT68 TaxID=3416522 RepID=UPI003CF26A21
MTDLLLKARQNTTLLADRPAIVGDVTTVSRRTLTWGELGTRIDGLVGGFRERGRKPGDRIGIAHYQGTFGLELYLAAQAAGLQPVLLGITLNKHLDAAARALDLKELFTGPELLTEARRAMGSAPVWFTEPGTDSYDEVARPDGDIEWVGLRAADTVSGIQYSTGTTGVPKGMVRSVGADFWDAVNRSLCMRLRHSERWVAASPTNINVSVGALRCMTLLGGTTIALDDVSVASIERNSEDGVTVLPLQAPAWREMLDSGAAQRLLERGLRVCVATGQRTPRATLRRLGELMTDRGEVVNSYGLTETSTLTILTSSMPEYGDSSSVGRPAPLSTVDIAPRKDTYGDPRGAGEVRATGPGISPGYILPSELHPTAPSNVGTSTDDWFYTGDVGRWDERGNLQILGRWKDAFVLNGTYVYPYEIEGILGEIPGVRDSVVLGLRTDGEAVGGEVSADYVAVVVHFEGDVVEQRAAIGAAVADFPADLRRLLLVDEMPRNSSAKINRAEVAALVLAGVPAVLEL